MQPGHLPACAAQRHEAIVVGLHIPEQCRHRCVVDGQVAEKPARQIDQVRALIDQLAAAGNRGLRAPFFLIADASAVAIARADEHQRTEHAGVDDLPRLLKAGVEAMIEPGLDDALVLGCRVRNRLHLGEFAARGLFHQHMAAGFDGAQRDPGELVVRRRNDHRIDVSLYGVAPVGHGPRLCLLRKRLGARRVAVADDDDLVARCAAAAARLAPMRPHPTIASRITSCPKARRGPPARCAAACRCRICRSCP